MGWRTVIVNTHSKLSYQNNNLIFKTAYEKEIIHLSEIDILLLETTDIVISTMLLKRLIDEKILVIFCDDKRLPKSMLTPFYGKHDSSLQLNKQLQWDENKKSIIWTNIISQKIINQSLCLNMFNYSKKADVLIDFCDQLELLDVTNREGHAARVYFNTLFGNDFSREDDTDINACLDYGYTLLLSMFAREIVCCGCMTQFGLKHANQFNQFNLASDIMEPFRALVDIIVYNNKEKSFKEIKKELFTLFTNKYIFNKKSMYLNNIVSEYTKKIIKVLNDESKVIPVFRL